MKLVTSFSPNRIEEQKKALKTWKKFNLPIHAVQCHGEVFAKQFTDLITWVKPNKHWSKQTPSLVHLLALADEPILLLNSDIELLEDNLDRWTPESALLKIGLRTDYCKEFVQLNKYGIDVFLITPDMVEILDNTIWALAIPGWDYWIVWKLINSGYQLLIHRTEIMHAAHTEQWDKSDYTRCAKLLEFEFNIPIQDIADNLQLLTEREHLKVKRVGRNENEARNIIR